MIYDEIIGQDKIKTYLRLSKEKHTLPHAILISGEEGSGKKSITSSFIFDIMCENVHSFEDRACLNCHACKQILANTHPDIIYVKSEKQSYKVEDIRSQINDTVKTRPFSSNLKIYVIDKAENMTIQAQNALLKTLEEPPLYVIIILLCNNEDLILETVKSRCIRFRTESVSENDIINYLDKYKGLDLNALDKDFTENLLAYSTGNIGKAIFYIENEDIRDSFNYAIEVLENILDMPIYKIYEYSVGLKKMYSNLNVLIDLIRLWYKDIAMIKVSSLSNRVVFKNKDDKLYSLARRYRLEELDKIFASLNITQERLRANVNAELCIQLLLMDCALK